MKENDQALEMTDIGNDWRFLWSQSEDSEWVTHYWERYVAVFQCEVVGDGATEEEARQDGMRYLQLQGDRDGTPPPERLCVDFCGED